MKGILGRKLGMTQVFTENGRLIPVTVIEVEPNVVTQIKTKEIDGYEAVQLGSITKKEKVSNKPEMGHVKKANTMPKRFLKEIRGVDVSKYTLGQEIKADEFAAGEIVDVTGTTKGKGTQGVIKRHNQSTGPMAHGSQYHRGVGSMGTLRPMRVFKGKKLPGRMGNETVTIQNLEIVSIDMENNLILIKGNVPGNNKAVVSIKTAIKNRPNKEVSVLKSYSNEINSEEVVENIEEVETEEVVENVEEANTEEVVENVEEVAESNEETNSEEENPSQESNQE